ncbi:MAG: MFS transporter [Fulvimonas sp.]|nr:MFS transporter [Fulvimonas sp.]
MKRTTAIAALAFFFLMTSYYMIRPVRDQLSGALGSRPLPLFYGATFLVMLLLTPLFGGLVARYPRKRLLASSYSFFIVCLIAFVPAFMVQDEIGALALGLVFYVWVSVFNLFVVSLFWSFMADVFDSHAARERFSLIALGGMGGAIFGPLLTRLLVHALGVAPLLLVSAAALLTALLLLLRLAEDGAQRARNAEVIGGSLWAGVKELWTRPFLRAMAVLMVLGDGIGTLIYALLADYAKAHYADRVARTDFYNSLDLATNLLGAALQLTLTRWVLVRRGPGWGLVVPALVNVALLILLAVLGSGTVTLAGVAVPVLAIVMVGSRGFAYGMTKPAADALYTRVPRETRYKGKNFVETAIWRFGDVVVTSAVNLLAALGVAVTGMAVTGVGVSALSAWVARRAAHAPDLSPEPPPAPAPMAR